MSERLALGDISLDAKRTDPRFTWIEVLGDGSVVGHVLVDTAKIEAIGSFEDAKGAIGEALQAYVVDRGFDHAEREIRLDGVELHIV